VQFREDRHEFLRQRVVACHQRVGGAVAHLVGDQAVLLAVQRRAAQAVDAQAPPRGRLRHAQPGGNVGHAPAKQPGEPELAKGALAVGAKALRNGFGFLVQVCHGVQSNPAADPAG
jgi:hypothetical protein